MGLSELYKCHFQLKLKWLMDFDLKNNRTAMVALKNMIQETLFSRIGKE